MGAPPALSIDMTVGYGDQRTRAGFDALHLRLNVGTASVSDLEGILTDIRRLIVAAAALVRLMLDEFFSSSQQTFEAAAHGADRVGVSTSPPHTDVREAPLAHAISDALIDCLADEDPGVRAGAFEALAQRPGQRITDVLLAILTDEKTDPGKRAAAAKALTQRSGDGVLDGLVAYFERERNSGRYVWDMPAWLELMWRAEGEAGTELIERLAGLLSPQASGGDGLAVVQLNQLRAASVSGILPNDIRVLLLKFRNPLDIWVSLGELAADGAGVYAMAVMLGTCVRDFGAERRAASAREEQAEAGGASATASTAVTDARWEDGTADHAEQLLHQLGQQMAESIRAESPTRFSDESIGQGVEIILARIGGSQSLYRLSGLIEVVERVDVEDIPRA